MDEYYGKHLASYPPDPNKNYNLCANILIISFDTSFITPTLVHGNIVGPEGDGHSQIHCKHSLQSDLGIVIASQDVVDIDEDLI